MFATKKKDLAFLGKGYDDLIENSNISVDLRTTKLDDILNKDAINVVNGKLDFTK